ncbi:MAG: hypothetical protein LAO07_05170, partial [Acidobacteriia bacterium]|nr:hypothetical protein [Terriglobia bacterium]
MLNTPGLRCKSDQPLAQDLLDVPDGAAVEEERRCHRMPQHVRGHSLRKTDLPAEANKPDLRRLPSESMAVRTHHKERLARVLAPGHVFFDPVERAGTEKHHALLVALADD